MGNYDDIINLEYKKSTSRKQMPRIDRAAQFAPFSALTGYDGAVRETARLTDRRIELDEYMKEEINGKLLSLLENENTEAEITYFVPDKRKSGGKYETKIGIAKKVNEVERTLVLTDKTEIFIDDILEIVII
ncbi:MAG: YolD-like family protein [Ruminococcaceae bacterium]|nr:YolD-like family protein [Oscillospiraceae bacterium]